MLRPPFRSRAREFECAAKHCSLCASGASRQHSFLHLPQRDVHGKVRPVECWFTESIFVYVYIACCLLWSCVFGKLCAYRSVWLKGSSHDDCSWTRRSELGGIPHFTLTSLVLVWKQEKCRQHLIKLANSFKIGLTYASVLCHQSRISTINIQGHGLRVLTNFRLQFWGRHMTQSA